MTYASMYAFRKPFNAGSYEGLEWFNLPLKDILLISQIIGYMLSKFIGIKVISEMSKRSRISLIIKLILTAHFALLLFAFLPIQYKFLCLFLNGLPLGMVWGVVFSFLEGRKFTELIATGIAVGAIVSSGFVKSVALFLMDNSFYAIPEFWMPFSTGLLFLPVLLLSVWMLSKIPEPNETDKRMKVARVAMNKNQKITLITTFSLGIFSLVLIYLMQTIFRDFRDNFAVELLTHYHFNNKEQFVQMELIIGIFVIFTTSLIALFKNNFKGFQFALLLSGIGFLLMLAGEILFLSKAINFYSLMLISGLGMSIGYVPFQIALFERFIAAFQILGNVGFLMYISDSTGYLGSVILLLSKNFGLLQSDNVKLFHLLLFSGSIIGFINVCFSLYYFKVKRCNVLLIK
ncbi:MAG: hypothetical protein RL264_1905 [Bacteroidota bacterium]|jgi:MFS family permease